MKPIAIRLKRQTMKTRGIIGIWLLGLLVSLTAHPSAAQEKLNRGRVLKLEELTFSEIDALDRDKTIFFLTFGNLEEHGPHLPVGSDYYGAVGVRDGLIARLQTAHHDHSFVIMPVVPLGEGGGNDLAYQFDHIGTFAVRFETLRDVAVDLGTSVARKGFQKIFLIHAHGAPLHNMALTQAAAFVSERYGVRMVNLTSLVFAEGFGSERIMDKHLGEGWQERIGWEGHAGARETSGHLFLRGDLVKSDYKRLPPFVAKDFAAVLRTREREGWQGYWGDPARASKQMGKELIEDEVERHFRIAQMALAGKDLSQLPVYPDNLPPLPESEELLQKQLENHARQKAEIEAWLRKRH